MTDQPRLIEHAFPLKQASLDSVHEKNVRHGHISTLHIWPARRPLAACRAALIATLLPDPGDPEKRRELCEKIGGRVVEKIEKKKMPNGQIVERIKEVTEGGVLHWHGKPKNDAEREIIRQQQEDIEWFRQEIRKAYGGRAPKVLDPFAGGGAIPLEAMRLGCEVTAVDINPVAWFILKCTLEYPQKFAGQTRPLPDFILTNRPFMEKFLDAQGMGKAEAKALINRIEQQAGKRDDPDATGETLFDELIHDVPEADLAWHVRAWGQWVLDRARRDLAKYYPTYADFEPLKRDIKAYEKQPMQLVPLRDDGVADIDALNGEFTPEYLKIKSNPRWVAKPTVAYLWARTVTCKNCRATVPLLKTRWLCKKTNKRVLLTMEPNADGTGVDFGIDTNVPAKGGNAAQKREHDKRIGDGTLTLSGGRCLCCNTIMTLPDIQVAAQSHEWGHTLCAVIVDGASGKEYRSATDQEAASIVITEPEHPLLIADPLNEPIDPTRPSPNARGLSGLTRYGITTFGEVFSARQQTALATLCGTVAEMGCEQGDVCWMRSVTDLVALTIDHIANRNSTLCHWDVGRETISSTFQRYALRINWDYVEGNPTADGSGSFSGALEWIAKTVEHVLMACMHAPSPTILLGSATELSPANVGCVDLVLTDPPYYDAIPYADLSDFFYIWMRRTVGAAYESEFRERITDKCQELIQHAARTGGDNAAAKLRYENGMAEAFRSARDCLRDDGRLVIVFAHKHPDAWETLVSSIIRAGFAVDGSWPIETEMPNKAAGGARLASSIWLVCKKRPETARPGWDNAVLDEMRANIGERMREYWDAGIRGPDFVWAATGPALEAYSKHPVVKKANEPGPMTVGEFLNHVRRIVVDFVVGRVLSGDGDEGADTIADRLDDPTAYYLLHRNDFGFDEAPAGTVILYAVSCGLSDRELVDTWGILASAGKKSAAGDDDVDLDPDSDADIEMDSGSKFKLKTWAQRTSKTMGYEAPRGRSVPLIDRVHRLMHLWKAGDVHKVDEYLDEHGLRRQELFARVIQSLIELSDAGSSERSLLESLSNHIGAKGAKREKKHIPEFADISDSYQSVEATTESL